MDSAMLTNQPTGDGQRWGQRIAVDIPVQVAASASPAIHGHLKNLSLSGALMTALHENGLHQDACAARAVLDRIARRAVQ
jgi:hypothetical protein